MRTFRCKAWVEKYPEEAKALGLGEWVEVLQGFYFGTDDGPRQEPAVAEHIRRQKGNCARCGDPGAEGV